MASNEGGLSAIDAARQNAWKAWAAGLLAAALVFAVPVLLMERLGLLDVPIDETGTKTLAAALGLVGSALAASITLIGTVLKYSIDDRNAALAVEVEKRNRIEASIRAVDLLGENNKDAA